MGRIWRIQFPMAEDMDFIVGKENKRFGKVLDIQESRWERRAITVGFFVVVFENQQMEIPKTSPFVVIYRLKENE